MVLALFHSRLHPSWKGSAGDNSAEVDRKEDSLGVIPPENKLDEEIRHTPSTTRHAMQGPDDADTAAQLKANVLACSTNDPSKIHDFTDGLCDFIFYTTEKSYVNTRPGLPFREDDFLVHHLRIKAASSTSTAFGIDVTAEFRQQSLNDLQTPEGKHVVEGNWKSKVRSYAALDVRVSREEESNTHIVIKFLKKLKAMQAVLTKDADIGYIFLGVIIESMNGSARDALSSQQRFQRNESNEDERHHFFNKILREVEPHAVVFVTTYRKYYAGAEDSISRYGSVLPFTTPSVWNTSAVSEQPTFVDTLAFWSALDNVPGVPVMFSFSVAGRVCRPLNVQKLWTGNNVTGLCTTTSPGFITDYICENSNIHSGTLDGYNVQESLWNHAAGTLIGYDSNITMKKKMCSVFADYGFRGGWMLYDIEFMEKIPPCDIMVEKSESYYPVHFVKRILKGLHTDCAQLPI
ncbi:uncharacterized protein LOC135390037 isoform X3 [Ornithodoros turicata]|uniref:uncharacterized protein LOC135390037 isoform X3 n=1 Tax=Ornithodoros turicata TaxID=34597 RepID=UPI0031386D7F